jgi:isoquinoline 1-oxidoreductase alpha subunit
MPVPPITLQVNGRTHQIDADPEMPLLWALRDSLGLVGTKFGCGGGFCGACTVHVDGAATRSCTLPLGKTAGRAIVTIEGLAASAPGADGCGHVRTGAQMSAGEEAQSGAERTRTAVVTGPVGDARAGCSPGSHPVQRAWVELDVAQCGYCQAGQIMTAAALLARTPSPTDEQIATAMQGNLCRCGTYMRIREAVRRAAADSGTRDSGGVR